MRSGGGFLAGNCHVFMHEVGRTWARRHGVTLETMFRYVPKSNDPGCSAGFGMGMVMHLGTQLILEPRKVIPSCLQLPTRFRQYTCFHGSGHAFMRGYHSQLSSAVIACKALGARFTPDCAQGAFHDYWISLNGVDDTERPKQADTNPRSVCASYAFPRPCWYRFFWERKQSASVADEGDLRRLCRGVAGAQRAGCIGGASLLLVRGGDPVYHARTCGRLSGNDALNCLRGVNVPALAGNRYEQIRLLRTCTGQPKSTRNGCYGWFGRTLNVVTNGRFERSGCRTAEHLRGPRRVYRGCAQARRAARHVLVASGVTVTGEVTVAVVRATRALDRGEGARALGARKVRVELLELTLRLPRGLEEIRRREPSADRRRRASRGVRPGSARRGRQSRVSQRR